MAPRTKEFNPDEVLESAMEVFWRKGYKPSSIQELVDSMGINRFSIYNTFGGKHELFMAAFQRYVDKIAEESLAVLEQNDSGLQAIRNYFEQSVDYLSSEDSCKGCLIVNSIVELGQQDIETAKIIKSFLERWEKAFHKALKRASEKNELRQDLNLKDTARYLVSSAIGLAVIGKTRPGRKALEGVVERMFAAVT